MYFTQVVFDGIAKNVCNGNGCTFKKSCVWWDWRIWQKTFLTENFVHFARPSVFFLFEIHVKSTKNAFGTLFARNFSEKSRFLQRSNFWHPKVHKSGIYPCDALNHSNNLSRRLRQNSPFSMFFSLNCLSRETTLRTFSFFFVWNSCEKHKKCFRHTFCFKF